MELGTVAEDVLMGDTNEVTVPAAVMASAPVLDIGFHPKLPIMAAGLVTGEVEIYERRSIDEMVKVPLQNDFSSWIFKGQYSEDAVVMNYHHQNMLMHPSGGVSSMEFTDDGTYLVTASGDGTISVMDCVSLRLVIHIPSDEVRTRLGAKKGLNAVNKKNDPAATGTAGVKKSKKTVKATGAAAAAGRKSGAFTVPVNPHKYGISCLNVCDENVIATGDDDGLITLWDMRERKPAHVYHEHGDYVSQLCYFTDAQELVSSSGDTCLGAYDVRAGKIRDFSVRRKDEINCFAFINSSGISNATFIPSLVCGTPHGGLPIWKYGSWARPYDVLDRHPADCEAILSFHGENTAFNHNLILTGACDGLVRVLQMYPVRRNLCQLSARDYTYSHSSVLGAQSSSGGQQQQGNYVVRRARGQEAISRMRVSHDANLLAVSGADNIIDFVDIAFMNDEGELDQLRGRAEQRHLRTIRELDRERNAEDERERRLMEGRGEEDEADGDGGDATNAAGSGDSDTDSSSTSSGDSGSENETEAERQAKVDRREALRQKFATLGITQKKKRSHSESSSSGSSEADGRHAPGRRAPASAVKDRKTPLKKTTKREPAAAAAATVTTRRSTGDAAAVGGASQAPAAASADGASPATTKKRNAKVKVPVVVDAVGGTEGGSSSTTKASEKKSKKKKSTITQLGSAVVAMEGAKESAGGTHASGEAEAPPDSMEVYRTERQKKRERAAAARWLKEERRKKINFTYEKRRRRVGGFFGDMVNRDGDSD
ncbi:WD domain, G-beta repeat [Novymonas esmeraldas]|uniref:WD domain, G-beta repeat n=1 Tax=Novymonas esmeraldas TaxID=1808958 RepID=A0AAW0F5I1_9TRYP